MPEVVDEVVVIVISELSALTPVMFSEVGLNATVGGLVAPLGLLVTAPVKATLPVNPPEGVALTPTVLPVVAPGVIVIVGAAARVNPAVGAVAPLTSALIASV